MVDGSRKADSVFRLIEFLRTETQREEKIDQQIIKYLNCKKLPTLNEVRETINSRVGEKRRCLLRHHVYWKERHLRLGLESLIRAAHQAYVDICRHDAALGSLSSKRDFEDHVDHTVGYAAQKDMVAYCSLVIGVSYTLGALKKERSDISKNIKDIENEFSANDVAIFVRELRNNLLHGSVVVPEWSISYDFQNQSSSGSMKYTASELLKNGRWKDEGSKRYLLNATNETINLSGVVGEHYKLLEDFDRKIQYLFAWNVSPAEKDFFEIEDSYKRVSKRQWAKIMISQIGKGKDPYKYLHLFFDSETVREILRRPRYSKEQVDFIIALKAAELDCDDDLQHLLYEKFGVTVAADDSVKKS